MSATPGPDLLVGLPGSRRALVWVSFVVVAFLATADMMDAHGRTWARPYLAIVPLALTIGLAPLLRGARPRRLWALVTVGVGFLLLAPVLGPEGLLAGQPVLKELSYVIAYLSLGTWIALLAMRIGTGGALQVLLDAAAAAAGAFLAFWSFAGFLGQSRAASALVWFFYPVLDILVLALAVHLAYRLPRPITAWRWVIGSVVVQACLDTIYFVLGVFSPSGVAPSFTGLYLFTYWGLAVAATHPSVSELTRAHAPTAQDERGPLRSTLIILAVVPALVAMAVPVWDPLDGLVRSVVVSTLLAILFARLLMTMRQLARAEAASRHRSLHDPLTGLLNRAGLFEVLGRRLEADDEAGASTALLFLDCDDFKHVNDTWGHPAGDALLCAIAQGLPPRLRDDDVLARPGGDEFVVVTTVKDAAEAIDVAERAMAFFDRPLLLPSGRTHGMTLSIGIVVSGPERVLSAVDLVEMADTALYEAKNRGRARYVLYDDELDEKARYRAAVSDALQSAITAGRIAVHHQPILGGADYGELAGWEALARWTEPELGAIPPTVFVPLAEEHGLIDALGELVLRQACRQLVLLREAFGTPDAIVSVNVSPVQFRRPRFVEVVVDALADAGLDGDALWLEVTETTWLEMTAEVVRAIGRLQAMGVKVCLDDFGTGYASVDMFLHRSVDCVKIDKSLVHRIADVPEAEEQLTAFLDLMRTLHVGLIVAEGVETHEQAATLRSVGCPMVQGWLYGRPASVERLLADRGHDATSP